MKEIKIYQKSNKIYNPRDQGYGHAMFHRPVGTKICLLCWIQDGNVPFTLFVLTFTYSNKKSFYTFWKTILLVFGIESIDLENELKSLMLASFVL